MKCKDTGERRFLVSLKWNVEIQVKRMTHDCDGIVILFVAIICSKFLYQEHLVKMLNNPFCLVVGNSGGLKQSHLEM